MSKQRFLEIFEKVNKTTLTEAYMGPDKKRRLEALKRDLNTTKSINRGEWFGIYKDVEWTITSLRDGNKNWYYIQDQLNGDNFQPTEDIYDAFTAIKSNIEFGIEEKLRQDQLRAWQEKRNS